MSDPSVDTADYGFATATELLADLQAGALSSVELTEALIVRIQELDDTADGLKSVLAINPDALAQAQYADANPSTKPLHGLPVLVKDNIEAVGLPATAGSLALAGRTVVADAPLVKNLRDAGAIILGSTNLSEWANIRSFKSTSGWSAVNGVTANPWKYQHNAGGSSSGSGAAIAAGLAPLAVGTETDGSIVCPSSLNGVVGIKPTVGLVSREGVIPVAGSMDSPGPMGRNVPDIALMLEVMAGVRNLVQLCDDESPLRIGVVDQWRTGEEETNAVLEQALNAISAAGIELVHVKVAPHTEQVGEAELTILLSELKEDLTNYLIGRSGAGVQSLADVVQFNLDNADTELAHFDQSLFELALATGGRDEKYRSAKEVALNWAVEQVLAPAISDCDVLIGASYGPAWKSTLGAGDDYDGASPITCAPALAGWPIGCLPMGFVDGLPVGLGVVARPRNEAGLVRAMGQLERVLGFSDLRPSFIR
ncbi:MAG: amidase [Actinobacteria bacterium]|nr:amidase [Actinomycetota bacterium]NBY15709.1 amidase [Actinomycetota bacterium]